MFLCNETIRHRFLNVLFKCIQVPVLVVWQLLIWPRSEHPKPLSGWKKRRRPRSLRGGGFVFVCLSASEPAFLPRGARISQGVKQEGCRSCSRPSPLWESMRNPSRYRSSVSGAAASRTRGWRKPANFHTRIPAARLFFVFLCVSRFSSTGGPEAGDGDKFWGS